MNTCLQKLHQEYYSKYNKERSRNVGVNIVRKPTDTVEAFKFPSVKHNLIKLEVSKLKGSKVI